MENSQRHRGGGLWVALVTFIALAALVIVVLIVVSPKSSDNPFTDRSLYVYPQSSAAVAAADEDPASTSAAAFTQLADTPTAIWLLPEAHPTAEVAEFVRSIEADAAGKKELPVFVVYGIPSRDCGNFSAGGANSADYPLWISAIATGLAQTAAIVILEPDAIALSPSCGTETATADFLNDAITRLKPATATSIYLDGGHSNWLAPDVIAPLLKAAGVSQVRGFVTNVSNYNSTSAERSYADTLSGLLGGAHYVIDISRNGNGSNGEWCNPAGRKIGDTPSGNGDGSALDASLWIKNPGESDGTCNGGPPAGQWWPEQALELVLGGS